MSFLSVGAGDLLESHVCHSVINVSRGWVCVAVWKCVTIFLYYIYDSRLLQYFLIFLIVMHQNTKANSFYVTTYLAINLVLIIIFCWPLSFVQFCHNTASLRASCKVKVLSLSGSNCYL